MRNSWLAGFLILITFASLIWFIFEMAEIVSDKTFADFSIYFRAAESARANQPIYDIDGMRIRTFDPFYKYPPLIAHLLKGFVPFGLRKMALIWFYCSIAFYVGSLFLWLFTAKIPLLSSESFLLACLLFSSQPAVDSLSGPQMDCFMLFLFFVCCWAVIRNHSIFAGGSIAIATMIKVFPAILLLPLIQKRRLRDVAWFLLIATSLILFSILLAGTKQNREFLTGVLPANISASSYIENQSLFGFLSRFVVDGSNWNEGRPANLPVVLWITRILSLTMLFITVYVSRRRRVELALAAFVVWILIALPVVWIHYQTLLFFPAALYLHHQIRERIDDTFGWLFFALAWACISYGNQSLLPNAPVLLQSYKFFGTLVLWILFVRAMKGVRQPTIQLHAVAIQ